MERGGSGMETSRESQSSVELTSDARGAVKIVVKVYRDPGCESEAAIVARQVFAELRQEYPVD
jgi:hypothetical protein